jgi:hypothetical protein
MRKRLFILVALIALLGLQFACFAPDDAIRRSFSLGFRGSAAFASGTVHASFFPPDLIRYSAVRQRTVLSLVVSLLFL